MRPADRQQLTPSEAIEAITNCNTKEWNESISSRLEPLSRFFSHAEWTNGVSVWLRALTGNALLKLMDAKTLEEVHYIRGFVAALKVVHSLPSSVEADIAKKETERSAGPKGDAGY